MVRIKLSFAALTVLLAAIAVARADQIDDFLKGEMERQRSRVSPSP